MVINRRQLKVVFLLLDIRRIPNDHDKMLCEWLKALAVSEGLVPVYVLTKCDKLTRGQINQSKLNIAKELFISPHDMIVHSSEKGIGRMEILTRIEELVDAFKKEEKTLRDKEQAELDEDEDYEEESNEEYGDEYDDAGDEK